MGFYAFLDVDNGELLSMDNENGINMGNPLAAFLIPYKSAITRSGGSPELSWFSWLVDQSSVNLRVLTEIIYGDDMRYSNNEYERFIEDWGDISGPISEADFKQKVDEVAQMWTPIDKLLLVVEEIICILPQMGEDTYWYVAKNTQPPFLALLNSLKQAQNKGGTKVRILIR